MGIESQPRLGISKFSKPLTLKQQAIADRMTELGQIAVVAANQKFDVTFWPTKDGEAPVTNKDVTIQGFQMPTKDIYAILLRSDSTIGKLGKMLSEEGERV